MKPGDDTLARMVLQMAKKHAGRGRPKTPKLKKLSSQRMVRLDPTLDSAVEVRRQQLEREANVPVEWSKAMRDVLRAGAIAQGLIEPAGQPA